MGNICPGSVESSFRSSFSRFQDERKELPSKFNRTFVPQRVRYGRRDKHKAAGTAQGKLLTTGRGKALTTDRAKLLTREKGGDKVELDEWKIPSWIPDLPRPLIVVLWGLLLIWFAVGAYLESLINPGQDWWRYLWQGSVGGNGYNAWLATLSCGFLTTEVLIMIFTLRSNQARVERAERAAAATAAAEATAKATAEAEERMKAAVAAAIEAANAERERLTAELAARQQAWEGWNERRLAAEREGRPFTELPPGPTSGMNGNGSA